MSIFKSGSENFLSEFLQNSSKIADSVDVKKGTEQISIKNDHIFKIYKKFGELSIKYEQGIEDWMVHAKFKRAGKTEFVLESPDGKKTVFDISIQRNTYTIKEKNN